MPDPSLSELYAQVCKAVEQTWSTDDPQQALKLYERAAAIGATYVQRFEADERAAGRPACPKCQAILVEARRLVFRLQQLTAALRAGPPTDNLS